MSFTSNHFNDYKGEGGYILPMYIQIGGKTYNMDEKRLFNNHCMDVDID